MKVLFINNTCKYSSTGKICYELYKHLNADGHQAYIAYGRGDEINEPGIYKFGIDSETKIHALKARITGKNACYSPRSTKRLLDFIEEVKPDLVHLHELHAYFVNRGELLDYLKKKEIPVVWTFHCSYMFTGKCGVTFDCERYKEGCGHCPYMHRYINSWFFDRTVELLKEKKQELDGLQIKKIVTPSSWLANKTADTFLGNRPIGVVNNGIDAKGLFYPRKDVKSLLEAYDIEPEKKIILSVAEDIMYVQKGGQTILDVSKTLPEVQFVLIGAKETKKISDNVQMIKRTKDQEELARWYTLADLFLICSRGENFPTTCIEALCCGTPIVGIDDGGAKETADEPFGIFVKADSVGYDALIEDIKDAIQTQLSRGHSSERIREYAVNRYDNVAMYKSYLEIYKS
ncbi:MAG: glycosyltransferase [Pseudobutyrivibrio sp.]|nr:glycosyltransferase [Pseudobutyrivibrio sp.]